MGFLFPFLGAAAGSTIGANLGAAALESGAEAALSGGSPGVIAAISDPIMTTINESPFLTSALGGPVSQQGVAKTLGGAIGGTAGGIGGAGLSSLFRQPSTGSQLAGSTPIPNLLRGLGPIGRSQALNLAIPAQPVFGQRSPLEELRRRLLLGG